MQYPTITRKKVTLWTVGAVWALASFLGIAFLAPYQMTPGQAAAAPMMWPHAATLARATDRSTLVMFVSSQCPCSWASLEELKDVLAASADHPKAVVIFSDLDSSQNTRSHSDLWNRAQAIAGVETLADPGAALARLFGARTSGQVLVYDPRGNLTFNGGITNGRGHLGGNKGLDAAIASLQNPSPRVSGIARDVYGCALLPAVPVAVQPASDGK
jgi:hypothetical protein